VSYLLYLNWKPAYALILFAVTAVTYGFARLFSKKEVSDAKAKISVGIVLSLLPLLIFKYYNFINTSVSEGLSLVGLKFALPGLNWAIPVGISFFTFQAIGYLWDVYYKRIEAEKDFLSYTLFLSFFPSIVAGPINKASLVLPQIKAQRPYFVYDKAVEGLKLILWGMFMKVVAADRICLYVDTVYGNYEYYSGLSCFVASVMYSIQIYADFAGYSLMAIGVGKLLGFELTPNFNRPYFAVSVTDFWRRWHISLSTWLKDYVYIPLGGNRCSKARNYWNIFITFLVSGIWHGANWTFIVWGIWHGVFQIIEKAINQQKCRYGKFGKGVKIGITFLLVNFAWIFFRMPTLADACEVIKRIFTFNKPFDLYLPGNSILAFMVMGLSMLFVKDVADEFFPTKLLLFNNRNRYVRWFSYVSILVIILLAGVFDAGQFIYAKF
jgi:alginate O-acetyltransferase complex protein AlgI